MRGFDPPTILIASLDLAKCSVYFALRTKYTSGLLGRHLLPNIAAAVG